jgi:hypothetical protein
MSLGYAERLSYREDLGGRLGDPEIMENAQEVLQKIEQLTSLVSCCANPWIDPRGWMFACCAHPRCVHRPSAPAATASRQKMDQDQQLMS